MFRPMRRIKQQVSDEECIRILKEEKRAALSVIGDDGYPYTVPIDFYYDESDGRIYLHCAKTGHKIDAIKNATRCALLYGIRVIKPKETGNGTLPVLLCSGEFDLLTTGAFGKIN